MCTYAAEQTARELLPYLPTSLPPYALRPAPSRYAAEETAASTSGSIFCASASMVCWRAASANHACAPNCDVIYEDDGPLRVSFVAARDIGEGEELTISYVDSDQDAVDRRAATADYGFLCECPRGAGVD
mgnify:CR=1 FL=1